MLLIKSFASRAPQMEPAIAADFVRHFDFESCISLSRATTPLEKTLEIQSAAIAQPPPKGFGSRDQVGCSAASAASPTAWGAPSLRRQHAKLSSWRSLTE